MHWGCWFFDLVGMAGLAWPDRLACATIPFALTFRTGSCTFIETKVVSAQGRDGRITEVLDSRLLSYLSKAGLMCEIHKCLWFIET